MYEMYSGFEMVRYPLAVRYKRATNALHDAQPGININDSFSEHSQTPDVAVAAAAAAAAADDDDGDGDNDGTHLSNEMPAEPAPAVTSEPGTPTVNQSINQSA